MIVAINLRLTTPATTNVIPTVGLLERIGLRRLDCAFTLSYHFQDTAD
jgi:hypothetical protein